MLNLELFKILVEMLIYTNLAAALANMLFLLANT